MSTHSHQITKTKLVRNRIASAVYTIGLAVIIATGALGIVLHARIVPVLTGSMSPVYKPGALVGTVKIAGSTVNTGQIIAFQPPQGFSTPSDLPVMHRVVSVERKGEQLLVQTKGDANPTQDPWTLDLANSPVQLVVFGLPQVGHAVAAVKNTDPRIAALSIGGLVLALVASFAFRRRNADTCPECAPAPLASAALVEMSDESKSTLLIGRQGTPKLIDLTQNREEGSLDWLTAVAKRDLEADWVSIAVTAPGALNYPAIRSESGGIVHNFTHPGDYLATPCFKAASTGELLVINNRDAECEPAMASTLAAEGLQAYMAAPLISSKGELMGALCVGDYGTRGWHAAELDALIELARAGAEYIESSYVAPKGSASTKVSKVITRVLLGSISALSI